MSVLTIMMTAGILVVLLCSFVYLATVMVANWKLMERTKGSPFHSVDEGVSLGHVPPHHDCFEACMYRFAWNVDEVPSCTRTCKPRSSAPKAAMPVTASGA